MADDGDTISRELPQAEVSQPWPTDGRAAVVIAGAGARGAYEAGALAELLPVLFPNDGLRDVVLLGTSAGSVNAALWAQYVTSGASLTEVGEKVCEFWKDLTVEKVFRPILLSGAKEILLLKPFRGHVTSLLDTTPLFKHAEKTINVAAIADNIGSGRLGGVGVVATTCPEDGTGGRSRVFLQHGARFQPPKPDPTSAIDYVAEVLTSKHVLASAAIPGLFPAVQITKGDGYYCDGGVRLNTPIEPALKLGATRLVIASSHATEYPKIVTTDERPDVVDLAAQAIHVVLADGMIEDLRTLKRINQIVRQAAASGLEVMDDFEQPPRPYRDVPFIAAAPEPGTLAKLARSVFSEPKGLRLSDYYRRAEYDLIEGLIAGFGRGAGNDEILSYLLFDRTFATKQIERGRADAKQALTRIADQPAAASPLRKSQAGVGV